MKLVNVCIKVGFFRGVSKLDGTFFQLLARTINSTGVMMS